MSLHSTSRNDPAPVHLKNVLGVQHTFPQLPHMPGICDCHVHIFGDAAAFPFDQHRHFTPGRAFASDLVSLMDALGLARVIIVQPSVYGTDNRCTLDALAKLPGVARAVGVIGNDVTDSSLQEMHEAGMRGVRLNFQTVGFSDISLAREQLKQIASRVAHLGWHIQLFAPLPMITQLAETITTLPTRVVLDHFAGAHTVKDAGFSNLTALLRGGNAYVKLSAPYRIASGPEYAGAQPIVEALIAANPERVLWGSDWPHPGAPAGTIRTPDRVEPFRQEDDGMALVRLAAWVSDDRALRRMLVENPVHLYDFAP
ncbi:amidohydrolase family protein [Microvirga brassicacearum]|uniref:Amidohydrolase-related domain-containing protein n=1 Tax=Microvirga brassicacearum TaxID=2580413 RepID=A0A5N3PAT8_9HYPH|nr:amidohydrolase family protein [Microvirga brassicacearum]KAB0266801.1 hypothetical protein FEZ63_11940 [Microvirga brassicacearum]